MIPAFANEKQKWQAILDKNKAADGKFFFSVVTTGVYCRPSCGARLPKRENVSFHASVLAAEDAGFRPCKRCKPNVSPSWNEKIDKITQACRFIEDAEYPPSLEKVASEVGLSTYYFHRIFKEVTGITPKAYANAHRTRTVKDSLKQASSVTRAIYEAGYNANSRFYEKAQDFLGMSAGHYKVGADSQFIHYAIRSCSLGRILVAATARGICSIQLGENETQLKQALFSEFPGAKIEASDSQFDEWVDAAVVLVDKGTLEGYKLPLDIKGTAFQQRVWKSLQTIPAGKTLSYKEVAEKIGKPGAARAVAKTCTVKTRK